MDLSPVLPAEGFNPGNELGRGQRDAALVCLGYVGTTVGQGFPGLLYMLVRRGNGAGAACGEQRASHIQGCMTEFQFVPLTVRLKIIIIYTASSF